MARLHLRDLFAADAGRFDRFSLQAGPLFIDYSKHRLTTETLQLLQALAAARGVEPLRDAMWAGEPINQTEDRAVLHVALRNGAGTIRSRGADVMPDVRDVLARMRRFTDGVRDGSIRGHTGEAFTDIVNIGIGGSDLGPCMVTEALRPNPAGGPRA
ncbi:MAG: glucose-6-phosphate isomerase, partial [Burkholderiales bacterium]|nr:glucose-6-phosphate isomerase [Burkholderiales bacterium]